MSTSTTTVGFVGLGHMGGNMAARFLGAGYPVYGNSRERKQVQSLVDDGLRWCETPREVAEAADVVFTSVPDDRAVEAVAAGADGIVAGLGAGKTWIDVSTVSPRVSRDLAARAHAGGGVMLAAPVSGSVPQVKTGTLTIMVGGDRDAYGRVEPVLRELGSPVHVGTHAQALVMKLAVNISLAVQMLALSEGLVLAERSGMDTRLALDVMTSSAIGSPMLKARAPLILDLPDEAFFDVSLMKKDLDLVKGTARDLHVPLPTAERASEVLGVAEQMGYAHRDIAALFPVLERMSEQQAALY
jgi:3-hydroxyisobutyrate dehydrogenase-like beta-hydroxyacid dehydrogenase